MDLKIVYLIRVKGWMKLASVHTDLRDLKDIHDETFMVPLERLV